MKAPVPPHIYRLRVLAIGSPADGWCWHQKDMAASSADIAGVTRDTDEHADRKLSHHSG
jgi:hypothetical protein